MNEVVLAGNIGGAEVEAQYANMTKPKQNNSGNNGSYNVNNYLNLRLENGENMKVVPVRILPPSAEDRGFVTTVNLHSLKVDKKLSDSGFKKFVCLDNPNRPNYNKDEKCPLCEKKWYWWNKAKEAEANGDAVLAKSYKEKAKMYSSRMAYVVRVIDRKHEDEGIKFWRFNHSYKGSGVYDNLMTIYNARKMEYEMQGIKDYNIFDLNNGCDIFITVKRQFNEQGEEIQPSISLSAAATPTPLSTDVDKANRWLNDTKKWYDVYSVRTADYLTIIADEEIPVKDGNGGYVGKKPSELNGLSEEKKAEQQNEIQVKNDMLKSSEVPQNVVDATVGELPF